MEKLAHLIEDQNRLEKWKSIKLNCNAPDLSPLFVDNVVFFAEARLEQVQVKECVWRFFCMTSGQRGKLC